jgi:hypothetical protein
VDGACASADVHLPKAILTAHEFTLSDAEFRVALCRRFGLPILPNSAPTLTMLCGKALVAADSEEARTGPNPSGLCMLGHDNS